MQKKGEVILLNQNIQVFMKVAEAGSFTKAAKELFITSTAVMKHINNLETQLGFELFNRNNQGVSLTEAGKVFQEETKKIKRMTKEALHKARKASGTSSIIRLGTSTLTPGRPLINLWNSAYGNFPDYQLTIVPFDENHNLILDILDNLETSFDLFVSPCDSNSWLARANFLPLGMCSVDVAIPRGNPLAQKKILDVHDLQNQTLIIFKEGDSPTLDKVRTFLKNEVSNLTIESTDYYDIDTFNYCIKNNHLLLTLSGWKDIHPSFQTVPVKWQYQIPFGIIYAKKPSPLVEDFIETITAIQTSQP